MTNTLNKNMFENDPIKEPLKKTVAVSSNPLDVPASITVDRHLCNSVHTLAVVNAMSMREYVTHLVCTEINHLPADKYRNYHMVKYYLDKQVMKGMVGFGK